MGGFGLAVLRPEWLWGLVLVPLLYVLWRLWPPPLSRRRAQISLGLRVLLIALLVFALAGLRVTIQPHQRAIIAVVDLSASTRHSLDAESATVRNLAGGKGADDLFGVVTFGHDAQVELSPTKTPNFEIFQTQPDPSYTDVAGALRLAAGIIPDGYGRQLVLISDGRQNLGDAAATITALRAEGVRVDVYGVGTAPSSEVLVLAVDAPSEMRVGQQAQATVRLQSTGPAKSQIVLLVDGQEQAVRDLEIPAGISTQAFDLPALTAGLHTVRAELVNAQPDTYAENNEGEAAIRVLGQPSVLVLEGAPGAGDNLMASLAAGGMRVDRLPAARAPVDTKVLGGYDSVVVVNAAADTFPTGSLAAIAASVKDLGHGLVTIGGTSAYGPGGWQGTPLEDASPVRMDLPPRKEKPKVAVVLAMESMENASMDQVAIGAAEGVIDKLTPEDTVAVTDDAGQFVVPPTPVKDKKAIDHLLENARLNDGPYLPSLKLAGDALLKSDAPLKHIIMLGDGDEIFASNASQHQSLLEGYRAKGITTSAIGVNTHGSPQFMANMQDLARWGGGRFYESDDPTQVPQLFLKESLVSLRPWFEQQNFFPKVTSAGDLLAGVPLNAFPQLGGYVVTTPKPNSEIYFTSTKEDPVLAAWQYGLGRSVAWTSDSQGQWTAGLLRSPVAGKLFARMVAWTLPSYAGTRLQTEASITGDSLEVTVTGAADATGTLSVGVLAPDLSSSVTQIPAQGPGKWHGRIEVGATGTYLLHVVLARGGATIATSDTQVVVPYPPEYLQLGRDDAALRDYANLDGKLLANPAQAWTLATPAVPTSSEVFWFLLALVALLWPLDVALRRLTLTPGQVLAVARALASFRRPREVVLEAPPELVRLRTRVASYRRRPGEAAPPPVISTPQSGPPSASASGVEAKKKEEEAEALSARLLEARRKRRSGSGE